MEEKHLGGRDQRKSEHVKFAWYKISVVATLIGSHSSLQVGVIYSCFNSLYIKAQFSRLRNVNYVVPNVNRPGILCR